MHYDHYQHKIQASHLDRHALIYVRQSTLMQVRHNTASTARQYDLAQRARDLGWPEQHILALAQDLPTIWHATQSASSEIPARPGQCVPPARKDS